MAGARPDGARPLPLGVRDVIARRSETLPAHSRIVYEALSSPARLMKLPRELEPWSFDGDRIRRQERIEVEAAGESAAWVMDRDDLPVERPASWQVRDLDGGRVEVRLGGATELFVADYQRYPVRAAATVPTGFDPAKTYRSRNHPRGLQLAVYAASDAVRSVGIEWSRPLEQVPGDRVAGYASSAMGQLDPMGAGGMLAHPMVGKFTSSRHCLFSLSQMPADFIKAYVLGSVGRTAALIGAAEAPVIPEVLEGYRAMSALAEEEALREIDALADDAPIDHHRDCRAFAPKPRSGRRRPDGLRPRH